MTGVGYTIFIKKPEGGVYRTMDYYMRRAIESYEARAKQYEAEGKLDWAEGCAKIAARKRRNYEPMAAYFGWPTAS